MAWSGTIAKTGLASIDSGQIWLLPSSNFGTQTYPVPVYGRTTSLGGRLKIGQLTKITTGLLGVVTGEGQLDLEELKLINPTAAKALTDGTTVSPVATIVKGGAWQQLTIGTVLGVQLGGDWTVEAVEIPGRPIFAGTGAKLL